MVEEDEQYEKTDSGSSMTYPKQCGTLKKGDYVMIKDHPCKMVEMTTAKTGKHGHAKAAIVGIDIFTHKKHEDSCPTSHSIEAPFVTRKDYQLADIDHEGFVTLLLDNGSTKCDLKLPTEEEDKDMVERIKASFEGGKEVLISVMSAMGQEKIIEMKELAQMQQSYLTMD
eukprot:TRINITY_DN231_c0_g2_i1.p1 TRINITY_DN231_c0_g2~~TRINITY_DN231_c0_g2_i1.p1  ORF type:complete len:170 (-),score=52.41 TRINITY_DN231_c0_g2_i1:26-535(-)